MGEGTVPVTEQDPSEARLAEEERAGETAERSEGSEASGSERRGGRSADPEDMTSLEREGDIAADYLEELLDIADLDGDIDLDVEGGRAMVAVVGSGLESLVGSDGEVLDALQELTRLAVYSETGERSRLMLDVAGHRAARRAELVKLSESIVEEVRRRGETARLDPMTPFERKIVHDAVAAAGLVSESEGEEPERRVLVRPA